MKTQAESACYGIKTRRLVESFLHDDSGALRGLIVLRHSARHYDTDNPINEPFMGLTEEGKRLSFDWGKALPPGRHLNFFSSFIGRCIETAYLMDKGYVTAGGATSHNMIELTLSPFYVKDALRLFDEHIKGADFVTAWFNRDVPAEIIDPPEQVAVTMQNFWEKRFSDNTLADHLDICVTHDWNLYVLQWYFLGIPSEKREKVDYLDGLVVYKAGQHFYIAAPGHEPRKLNMR